MDPQLGGNKQTEIPWLLLGLFIWITDAFFTFFLGVQWTTLTNMSLMKQAFQAFFGVVSLIVMVLYLVRQRWSIQSTPQNFISYVVLLFVMHLTFFFGSGNILGNLIHIGTAYAVYFGLLKPRHANEEYKANIILAVIILCDFFLLSYINDMGITTGVIPIWFIALAGLTTDAVNYGTLNHAKSSTWLIFGVAVLFIVVYAPMYYTTYNFSDRMDTAAGQEIKQMFVTLWEKIKGVPDTAKDVWNQTTRVYQEDYYTGEIDSNAKRELGVFIEDMEISQPDFLIDEPVSTWATLVVSTLEDEIHVSTRCIADKNNKEEKLIADYLEPTEFDAEQYDQVPVDCRFNAYSFREGSHTITINTTFDFQTLAYQKKYFMNKERYYTLRREEIEPLDQYGITDKEPTAVYTSGPLMIGMDTRGSLLTVDTEASEPQKLMLGITLNNQWDGEIQKVDELRITVPSSMNLEGKCSGLSFSSAGSDEYGNLYSLDEPLGKIKDYKTIRCPFVYSEPTNLLGEAPLAIRYFKANAKYTYTIEKSTTVNVKMSDEIKKLKEKTEANDPVLSMENQRMTKEETREIDLHELTTDVETIEPNLFLYEVSDIENKDIVNCEIQRRHYLICTAKTKEGTSEITVTVNDLAKTAKVKFKVCVDKDCSTTDPDDPGPNEPTEQGPQTVQAFPTVTIDRSSSSTEQVYIPDYIKDGDGVTPVADFDFPEPGDSRIKRSITRSSPQIWFLFEPIGTECFENHPYTFTARDGDDNSAEFTIQFTVTGCTS